MHQFDLYVNTDIDTRNAYPYFVDVQSELIDQLNSRVVIPLTPVKKSDKGYPEGLCPRIDFDGKEYVLLAHQITCVPVGLLQNRAGSLLANRNDIVAAMDFLITGI